MNYDVIIIGAGLGALECATLLSRAGHSVLVLEQGAQVGGALQTFRRGGRLFDTGFHCVGGLGEGQSLRPYFDQLGLMQLPWQRLDANGPDRVMIGWREFRLAEGFNAFVASLAQDFPRERLALKRYAELLQSDIPMDLCAYDYLTELFHDPLLVNVLAGAVAMKLELRRQTLPLTVLAHCHAPYVESSWRLMGDGAQIIDVLMGQIHAAGGEVLCRQEVERLTVRDGHVVEAQCSDGRCYAARWFVSSVHPAITCQMVKPALRGIYPKRISRLENTCGMFTVQLSLKPHTVLYFNHNVYIYRKANVWSFHEDVGGVGGVMLSARMPEDGSPWASQIDLLTPTPWSQWRRWTDTRQGQRGAGYAEMKNHMAGECVELAERYLPGLADSIAARFVSTPLTWSDYTRTPCGSAFGLRKDCRQPLLTMLSPRTPLPNLLLTGQSVGLHGLQGVTMTAFETCRLITEGERNTVIP